MSIAIISTSFLFVAYHAKSRLNLLNISLLHLPLLVGRERISAVLQLVYLKGSYELIEERLHHRLNHFMKGNLLQSQFLTLEEPSQEEAIYIDISQYLDAIIRDIRNCVLTRNRTYI